MDDDEQQLQRRRELLLQCANLVVNVVGSAAVMYALPLYDKTPYHTSALSGEAWVRELLNGHPERIRNELGVHKHVFDGLIFALTTAGLGPSQHLLLEEQLAIFLYTCVTGLSLRHVSERLQRANVTISKYVPVCIDYAGSQLILLTFHQILRQNAHIFLFRSVLQSICPSSSDRRTHAT